MVTIRDVAAAAGVSPSTVSRVVRGLPSVSDDVRFRVQRAIKQLHYRPDSAARSIRTGRSHAVGYVVPDISNPTYAVVFRGAEAVLASAGYQLFLATSDSEPAREQRAIESLLSYSVDGLILSPISRADPPFASQLASVPTVLINRETTNTAVDVITSDHAAGMKTAVNHLIDLGHRRIAFLGGLETVYTTHARVTAFREALRGRGILPEDSIERLGDRSVEAGERHTLDLFRSSRPPTAIVAGGDQLLNGTLRAINALGLNVPSDVSIVGCDDSEISYVYRPAISVIKRDIEALGNEAARALLRHFGRWAGRALREKAPDAYSGVRRVLPTEFVVRGSTGPPRAS